MSVHGPSQRARAEFPRMATLCLIVLFGAVALAAGFGCGVWWLTPESVPSLAVFDRAPASLDAPSLPVIETERAAEWAVMAIQRIQDVATSLSGDASSHASKVDAITAELQS